MEIKKFILRKGDEIPEKSTNYFCATNNISDWYFGKILTIGGEESKNIVTYDFTRNEWLGERAGQKKVIEYYVEIK